MRDGETEIDMVRRHVKDGARHIVKQRAIIDRLQLWNLPTEDAEALLILFEDIQRQHQEHLARLARGLP